MAEQKHVLFEVYRHITEIITLIIFVATPVSFNNLFYSHIQLKYTDLSI